MAIKKKNYIILTSNPVRRTTLAGGHLISKFNIVIKSLNFYEIDNQIKKYELKVFKRSGRSVLQVIYLAILSMFSNEILAQSEAVTEKIDSFKQILVSGSTDSIHGEALTSLATLYLREVSDGIDSALYYAEKGQKWGAEKNIVKVQGESLDLLGGVWRDKQEKEKSIGNYQAAHDLFISSGDTLKAIKMKGNIASSLISFGEVEEAIKIKLENIDAFAKMKDSTALMVEYYGIGYAYSTSQLEHKALPYYLEAAKYNDHPLVLGTIGRQYSAIGKTDSAFYYLEKGLDIANPGSGFETDLLQKLGSVYFENGQYPESIIQFEKALKAIGVDSKVSLASRIRTNLTYAYIKNGNIGEARKLFNKVEHKTDNKVRNARYFEIEFSLLNAEKRYKEAFEAHVNFKEASDSLAGTDLKTRVEEIEEKYESEKKDIEINNLALQGELNQKIVKRQKTVIFTTLLALVLFGILSFFLFRLSRKLRSQKSIISKALSEKDLLLREIHHRVKNNLQLVSSLLTLQSRSIDDKVALQAINEGKSRVRSMALIHQDLYNKENLTGIGVKTYIEKLTQELFRTYSIDKDRIVLKTEIQDIELDVDTLVPLGLIINELITNSLKYAFPEGKSGILEVKLGIEKEKLILRISDDGIGYEESKIRDDSFGSTLINSLTEQLEGAISVQSEVGTTTEIVMEDFK